MMHADTNMIYWTKTKTMAETQKEPNDRYDFIRINTIWMYWTSVFFVGHISLPILAGLALAISPLIPKKTKVQQKDDLNASPENLSTETLGGGENQKSVELDKKED